MITAGYFLASCAVETLGWTTDVLISTSRVLPGSSSVCSSSLASVLYFTRIPVREGFGSTTPLLEVHVRVARRAIDPRLRRA